MSYLKILTATALFAANAMALSAQTEEAGNSFVHQHEANGYIAPDDPAVLRKLDEWKDLKFGVLFHWGLYSVPGICESWQICSEFRKKSCSNVKRQQLNGFAISQYSAGYVRENKFFLSSLIESFVCFSVHRTVRGPQSIVQNL